MSTHDQCGACHGTFAVEQLDISSNGYRCQPCAGAATVQAHLDEHAREQRARENQRFGYRGNAPGRTSYYCGKCNSALPKFPSFTSFAAPPRQLACPGCQSMHTLGLIHRANWMFALLWKISFVFVLALVFGLPVYGEASGGMMLVHAVRAALVLTSLFALVFAIPATLVASAFQKSPNMR